MNWPSSCMPAAPVCALHRLWACLIVPAGEEMVLTFDMQLEECLQPKYRGLQVRLASK